VPGSVPSSGVASSVVLWAVAVLVLAARLVQARSAAVWSDDFDVYWRAGRAALDGAEPWVTGFVYLPASLVAFVPFGLLPLEVGRLCWLVLSAAAVVLAAVLVARRLGLRAPVVVLLVLLAFPTGSALQFGNVTAVQVLLVVALGLAVEAGAWGRAVLLLAAGIALKPILLPCVLVLLARRRWRAAGLAVLLPAVASVAVLALVGGVGSWYRQVRAGLRIAGDDPASADLTATLGRVDATTSAGPHIALGLAAVLAVVALLGVVLLAILLRRRRDADPTLVLGICLLATFVAGSVTWAHYPLLLLPLAAYLLARAALLARVLAGVAVACFLAPEVLVGEPIRAVPPPEVFTLLSVGLLLLVAALAADTARHLRPSRAVAG
jgi:alpha-1,2-mannosyltransferase